MVEKVITLSIFDRAVYGLQLSVQFAATADQGNLNPLVGYYSMYGSPEGTVEFGHRGYESNTSSLPGVGGLKNGSVAVVTDDANDNEDASLTFTGDVDIFPTPTTNATTPTRRRHLYASTESHTDVQCRDHSRQRRVRHRSGRDGPGRRKGAIRMRQSDHDGDVRYASDL